MAYNLNAQWLKWDLKKYSDQIKCKFRNFMRNWERHMLVFDVPNRTRTFILGHYLIPGSIAKSIFERQLYEQQYDWYGRVEPALKDEFDNEKTAELDALKFIGIEQKTLRKCHCLSHAVNRTIWGWNTRKYRKSNQG